MSSPAVREIVLANGVRFRMEELIRIEIKEMRIFFRLLLPPRIEMAARRHRGGNP